MLVHTGQMGTSRAKPDSETQQFDFMCQLQHVRENSTETQGK